VVVGEEEGRRRRRSPGLEEEIKIQNPKFLELGVFIGAEETEKEGSGGWVMAG
jgi:hypothetical protein